MPRKRAKNLSTAQNPSLDDSFPEQKNETAETSAPLSQSQFVPEKVRHRRAAQKILAKSLQDKTSNLISRIAGKDTHLTIYTAALSLQGNIRYLMARVQRRSKPDALNQTDESIEQFKQQIQLFIKTINENY